MEFELKAVCKLVLEYNQHDNKTRHVSTSVNLRVSDNLKEQHYVDAKGLPTVYGTEALTNVFVQALIANVHQAHQNDFRDSAEHLRYIIKELECGFTEVTTITTADSTDLDKE